MSLRPVLVLTGALLVVTTVVYPAVVTGASALVFPDRARGSLVESGGAARGSVLLGQPLAKPDEHPEYLWGRPSAASVDASSRVVVSGGSNLGPTSAALDEAVRGRIAALRASGVAGPIPVDLVTASGSGLDPHVSPEAALIQVPRIARARGRSEDEVRAIVASRIEERELGVLGERRVNVLLVNLALDAERAR